mgnify:CR=1 FL=1
MCSPSRSGTNMRRSSLQRRSHTRVHRTAPSTSRSPRTSSSSTAAADDAARPGSSTSHAYADRRSRTSRTMSSHGELLAAAFLRGRLRLAPAPAGSSASSSESTTKARPETCIVSSAVDAFLSPARSVLASRSRTRSAVSSFLSAVLLRPAVDVVEVDAAGARAGAVEVAVVEVVLRMACSWGRSGLGPSRRERGDERRTFFCGPAPNASSSSAAAALADLLRPAAEPVSPSPSSARALPLPFFSRASSSTLSLARALPLPLAPGLVRMSAHRSSSAGGRHCGSALAAAAVRSSSTSGRNRIGPPGSPAINLPLPLAARAGGGAW